MVQYSLLFSSSFETKQIFRKTLCNTFETENKQPEIGLKLLVTSLKQTLISFVSDLLLSRIFKNMIKNLFQRT